MPSDSWHLVSVNLIDTYLSIYSYKVKANETPITGIQTEVQFYAKFLKNISR